MTEEDEMGKREEESKTKCKANEERRGRVMTRKEGRKVGGGRKEKK